MNDRLREAMRPPQYNDPRDSAMHPGGQRSANPDESEDVIEGSATEVHRSTGNRDAVKPVGGISKDTSPMHYRKGRNDKPIDLEDDDYSDSGENLGTDQRTDSFD